MHFKMFFQLSSEQLKFSKKKLIANKSVKKYKCKILNRIETMLENKKFITHRKHFPLCDVENMQPEK